MNPTDLSKITNGAAELLNPHYPDGKLIVIVAETQDHPETCTCGNCRVLDVSIKCTGTLESQTLMVIETVASTLEAFFAQNPDYANLDTGRDLLVEAFSRVTQRIQDKEIPRG